MVMVLHGELVKLMAPAVPKIYRRYITYEKDRMTILYVMHQMALYGTVKAALLFYRKLVSEMKEHGFQINGYDPCIATKIVNGKQMMVLQGMLMA